jgi:hypothetical protein
MGVWHAQLVANLPYLYALLGLAGLDLLLGIGRALRAKRFQSALLRSTAAKLIEELGLPLLMAILTIANRAFDPLVAGAMWLAIVSEATSIIEQLRGKTKSSILAQIMGLLKSAPQPEGGASNDG